MDGTRDAGAGDTIWKSLGLSDDMYRDMRGRDCRSGGAAHSLLRRETNSKRTPYGRRPVIARENSECFGGKGMLWRQGRSARKMRRTRLGSASGGSCLSSARSARHGPHDPAMDDDEVNTPGALRPPLLMSASLGIPLGSPPSRASQLHVQRRRSGGWTGSRGSG